MDKMRFSLKTSEWMYDLGKSDRLLEYSEYLYNLGVLTHIMLAIIFHNCTTILCIKIYIFTTLTIYTLLHMNSSFC